ncbi:MAG TPA: DMT family transporter [Burkholderiales bacterium]|nr:DMT family transporter [Burkholderiales bacterium]
MSIEVAGLVLVAAAFHAIWNTLIKIRGDRVIVMMLVTLAGSIFSLLVAPFVDAPVPESWSFLAATILLHTAYHFFLPIAYDHGDLGQVYPIARGSAPLLVAVGALVFTGETLTPLALLGTLCLACGVMALTFERESGVWKRPKPVIYALLTGVLIASYTVVDGMGARQAGSAIGFAVWLTIGDGLLTFLIVYIWKGRDALAVARRNLGTGMVGGVLQVGGYWIIVWALAVAPMAMVSSLRETSVLIAAVISTFILKEGFGVWRFVSASLIALGLAATKASK